MGVRKWLAWAVALAVVVIFLLGLGPLANLAAFGLTAVASIFACIALFFIGAVAAVVAIYWGRK